jgi:beta-lactamase class A
MQGYQNLGAQGQNLYGQQIGNIGVQQQLGGLQQQTDQAKKQASYEDFLNQQRYPYQQLGAMSDAIRGAPMTQQSSTLFTPNPSYISQLGGLATAGLGAYGLYNQAFGQPAPPRAAGGIVKSYAKGGLVKADRKPAGLSAIIISRIG